ncbi:hypothetical protein OUZ56_033392 [Daphnia magna]|uniref:Uncharacterized protein n=1 Tax=Daphnia magna TaxID=35525 RepID=A0ABQ9ZYE6_9CRUS|nr:hypothetical protein OUZ56_033392 [Daphnia magna]
MDGMTLLDAQCGKACPPCKKACDYQCSHQKCTEQCSNQCVLCMVPKSVNRSVLMKFVTTRVMSFVNELRVTNGARKRFVAYILVMVFAVKFARPNAHLVPTLKYLTTTPKQVYSVCEI